MIEIRNYAINKSLNEFYRRKNEDKGWNYVIKPQIREEDVSTAIEGTIKFLKREKV